MATSRHTERDKLRYFNSSNLIRDTLEELMTKGRAKDPKYSGKDLAKSLGIHRTTVYNLLSGRRSLSKKLVLKHLKGKISRLKLDKILLEIDWEKQKKPVHPKSIEVFNRRENGIPYLTKDQHEYTSDPYSFAIFHLFETENFVPTLETLAKRLNLSESKVLEKLKRLKRLGFLEKTKDFYKLTGARPILIDPKYNKATRSHILKLGSLASKRAREEAFDGKKRSKSYFEFWYFALNPAEFDKIKVQLQNSIKRFRSKQFKSKPKKIYSLGVNFVPVDED